MALDKKNFNIFINISFSFKPNFKIRIIKHTPDQYFAKSKHQLTLHVIFNVISIKLHQVKVLPFYKDFKSNFQVEEFLNPVPHAK